MKKLYLGVDIGGTKNAVSVSDGQLNVLEKEKFRSGRDIAPQILLDELLDCCQRMIEKYRGLGYEIPAVGISCGGPLDGREGVIYSPPNLPLWDAIPIKQIFETRLGIPTQLQNDADACALAEWKFGNGRGCENFIFLTFGTGLGAGLILNGKLYSGTNGMAGECGHIRLAESGPVGYNKSGSFEGFCSGGGIRQLAQSVIHREWNQGRTVGFCPDQTAYDAMDAKTVFESANRGDPLALEIVNTSAIYLGKGLSVLIDVLNPQRIVLGGIYTRGENLLHDRAMEEIKKEAIDKSASACLILPAGLGERIGDVASLTIAIMKENG